MPGLIPTRLVPVGFWRATGWIRLIDPRPGRSPTDGAPLPAAFVRVSDHGLIDLRIG